VATNYSFNISGTGGADARSQLPDRMTQALSAVNADPNATDEDKLMLQAIGQVLDFAFSNLGENCIVEVNVSNATMQNNGEESTAVALRKRPINRVVKPVEKWTPDTGPLGVKASAPASDAGTQAPTG
jgi:hypothetical protein